MYRRTRSFSLFPAVALVLISGLAFFALQLFEAHKQSLRDAFITTSAFCSSLASQASSLSLLLGVCLLLCGLGLPLVFGIFRLRQQVLSTRQFTSRLLIAKLEKMPEGVVPIVKRADLEGRIDVVAAEAPLIFCYGFWYPRVCLSTGLVSLLSDQELEAVIWHERYHLERRDPLRILIGRTLIAAFFYIPVLRDLERHLLLWSEIGADIAAVREQGSRSHLAWALYRLLSSPTLRAVPPNLALGGFDATYERVDYLLGSRSAALPRLSLPRLVTSLFSLGVLVSVPWWMIHVPFAPAQFCPTGYGVGAYLASYMLHSPSFLLPLAAVLACFGLAALAWRNYTEMVNKG